MKAFETEADTLPVTNTPGPRASGTWIAKDATTEDAAAGFRNAVESATDFSWLSKGDSVLLKLTLNSSNPYPATTDPWAVGCMIRLLREKGAGKIMVGDSSGVELVHWTRTKRRGSSRAACEKAGLLKIIGENGAEAVFFEELGYDAYAPFLPAGDHHWKEPIMITSAVSDADHIVYLPRVGSHVLGDITSGMKIGAGFLREDSRRVFHSGGKDFYAMYEEINHTPAVADKLRLVVSSGRRVLATFGPDKGHVTEPAFGPVIASEDILAHEMVAYAWLCYNREFETSFFDVGITGRLTKRRSFINKGFVWYIWDEAGFFSTPGIPLYIPGKLYAHPSIMNALKRRGGRPSGIDFEEVNPSAKTAAMSSYIRKRMG
jgi:uncharacterized protein (DUF362 family)